MVNTLLNLQKQLIFTSSPEIIQICTPLFKFFKTSYFNFVRRYTDGSEACLTTDPMWTNYFYEQKLYKNVRADKQAQTQMKVNSLKIVPWSQFFDSPVRISQSQNFGVGVGITLIFTHEKYADFFHFGTNNQYPEMGDIYYNYADHLIHFTHYFYDKAKNLISNITKKENKLYLPDRMIYKPNTTLSGDFTLNLQEFAAATKPKRFLIHNKQNGNIFITRGEMSCIGLLMQGKTASEIGDILKMSKRTVETHLKNVKQRLDLAVGSTKADLIAELYKNGFNFSEIMFLIKTLL